MVRFKAEEDCSPEAVLAGVVSNEANNFMTSRNAVLRSETIKYL
jgi:hypothetical protein